MPGAAGVVKITALGDEGMEPRGEAEWGLPRRPQFKTEGWEDPTR